MSMSMILAREARTISPRTTSKPTPVSPAHTRGANLIGWTGPVLVIIALLLAAVMPLALPTLTSPQSERVVVVDRNPGGLGGTANR
jgi:hypothetical protein